MVILKRISRATLATLIFRRLAVIIMSDYDLRVNCVSGGPGTGERGYGNCLLMVILFEATQVLL